MTLQQHITQEILRLVEEKKIHQTRIKQIDLRIRSLESRLSKTDSLEG